MRMHSGKWLKIRCYSLWVRDFPFHCFIFIWKKNRLEVYCSVFLLFFLVASITLFATRIHFTNGLNSLHRKWHTGNQYRVKSAENRMRSYLELLPVMNVKKCLKIGRSQWMRMHSGKWLKIRCYSLWVRDFPFHCFIFIWKKNRLEDI
jgi:hypothetical protein